MAINNFKPFALDPNANVTSQADWEALPALLSGFTAGKASSAQVNKAIRQASFIAAALAQYTANKSRLDVLDDGDLNGFISKMGTAFGKDFQALDDTLTALAGLATGANKLPYFTGTDKAAQTDLTSVGRDIIGKNTIADILTYLGLGTGLTGIVGQSRNAAMRITAASSTATWTADELVVETAIGGTQYRLNNLSLSINLATTGAGGMDTGAAPASGFVAIYAIYNPTTKTTAALAVNVTSAKAPEVYGGSNMPAGYTASALIAVCGTNSSGQLLPGLLTDRTWMTPRTIVLNVTVQNSSWTSMTLAAMVPLNAKRVMGDLAGATNSGNITMGGAGDSTNAIGASWPTYYLIGQCPFDVELSSPQTMYYLNTMPSGSTISFQVFVKGYVF
ncbi:hypothetical protein NMD46_12280 [Escherichia coli]